MSIAVILTLSRHHSELDSMMFIDVFSLHKLNLWMPCYKFRFSACGPTER